MRIHPTFGKYPKFMPPTFDHDRIGFTGQKRKGVRHRMTDGAHDRIVRHIGKPVTRQHPAKAFCNAFARVRKRQVKVKKISAVSHGEANLTALWEELLKRRQMAFLHPLQRSLSSRQRQPQTSCPALLQRADIASFSG